MQQIDDSQLLQLILSEAPIGIYTINKDGIIESFNPEMTILAGAKNASEVIGLNALTLPSYREVGLTDYFKRGLQGEPFFLPAVKYTSFTGAKTSYRLYRGVPVKNSSGEVEKLLLFVLDITEKVQVEEAEKKADRLATIVEQSPDAMLISDLSDERKILYWNKGAERMFGWTQEEAIGKSAMRLLIPEDGQNEAKEYVIDLKQGEIIHREVHRKHKDGHLLFVDLYIFPMRDKHGQISQSAIILRDISERKRFEEEMIKHDSELEKMNKLMVDRELRMIELKKENQELREKLLNSQQ